MSNNLSKKKISFYFEIAFIQTIENLCDAGYGTNKFPLRTSNIADQRLERSFADREFADALMGCEKVAQTRFPKEWIDWRESSECTDRIYRFEPNHDMDVHRHFCSMLGRQIMFRDPDMNPDLALKGLSEKQIQIVKADFLSPPIYRGTELESFLKFSKLDREVFADICKKAPKTESLWL